MEKVEAKVGTTQLFGLPKAGGVAVAGRKDAKPVPEAAKDEAWAASWLELADGAETPPELASLSGKLQVGRLGTFWTESTCWRALAMAARKAGDVGEKTNVEMDRAVEAILDSDGAEADRGRIPSDSGRDKASYICC